MTDWQGRCSQLTGIIFPTRSFGPGAFEQLSDTDWSNLIAEAREAIKTDARLELAAQVLQSRQALAQAALAKLSPQERDALRIVGV